MDWYLEVLKKYAVFSGRARRKEYWMFTLINLIISVVLMIIDAALGLSDKGRMGPLRAVYTLAVLIPGIAVSVRRLHDIGRSGWWLLIGLIPCVGGIVLLVFMIQEGQPEPNEYGPNPKADAAWPTYGSYS